MRIKNEIGFSLVEFLVSILLTSVVMLAIYSVYRVQTHTVKVQEGNLEAQEYARAVLDMIVRETRNVGYFPITTCAAPANTGGVISTSVGAQTFGFVHDNNADGDCGDSNEQIIYAFDTTGCAAGFGNITRKEGANAAETLTDCNVPTGTTNFSFVYYPQQTSGSAPPPYCYASAGDLVVNGVTCSGIVTANLLNIQRISISVTAQSKWSDADFSGQALTTVTSNSDLRNRGLAS